MVEIYVFMNCIFSGSSWLLIVFDTVFNISALQASQKHRQKLKSGKRRFIIHNLLLFNGTVHSSTHPLPVEGGRFFHYCCLVHNKYGVFR